MVRRHAPRGPVRLSGPEASAAGGAWTRLRPGAASGPDRTRRSRRTPTGRAEPMGVPKGARLVPAGAVRAPFRKYADLRRPKASATRPIRRVHPLPIRGGRPILRRRIALGATPRCAPNSDGDAELCRTWRPSPPAAADERSIEAARRLMAVRALRGAVSGEPVDLVPIRRSRTRAIRRLSHAETAEPRAAFSSARCNVRAAGRKRGRRVPGTRPVVGTARRRARGPRHARHRPIAWRARRGGGGAEPPRRGSDFGRNGPPSPRRSPRREASKRQADPVLGGAALAGRAPYGLSPPVSQRRYSVSSSAFTAHDDPRPLPTKSARRSRRRRRRKGPHDRCARRDQARRHHRRRRLPAKRPEGAVKAGRSLGRRRGRDRRGSRRRPSPRPPPSWRRSRPGSGSPSGPPPASGSGRSGRRR